MPESHAALIIRLEQLRRARADLRLAMPDRFQALLDLLTAADMIGICDDDDPQSGERYAAVVGTILPQLTHGLSSAAIQTILFAEYTQWFNTPPGGSIVGAPERYADLAAAIWRSGIAVDTDLPAPDA